ncbi:MAG: 1-acyl-sn-glycerol-3-phosphate acyltransferase [Bacteroidetes bacterium]|nr:1-acyl-sn-glycerol-3-phosphate acyltransferase [Bacteroidota bacterium]
MSDNTINEIPLITEHFIDIEKVFGSKNPNLLKVLPKFVFKYLRWVIHEDFINMVIYKYRNCTGLEFVDGSLKEFGVRIEVYASDEIGQDHQVISLSSDNLINSNIIPPGGRYIIASNHPLGGLDGLALMKVVGTIRPDIVFPVNDLLMNVPGLKPLFIPINKHGKNIDNISIIDQTFASDKLILYFPAGLVSRKHSGGIIKDLDWKQTFISKSLKYKRDIIPVYISGRNSNFFYNLSKWRGKLGIKANIEMLSLPDEMVRQKDKSIRIIFGKPIPWPTFNKSKTRTEWAEFVQNKVYAMAPS